MTRSLSEEFVPEAEELLDRMEADLAELGRGGQPPERIADRLNALFRSAHSLKGMAGMAGLAELSHLSHEMEELMDHLRMGRLQPEPQVLDLIGDGMTLLRRLIAMVAQPSGRSAPAGDGSSEVAAYSTRIKQALTPPPASSGAPLDALGIPPHLTAALTGYEEHRLRENLRLGRNLYSVRLRFALNNFDRQLAEVTGRLQEIGELITTVPQIDLSAGGGSEPGEAGQIGFDLVIGSSRGQAEVVERAGTMTREIVLLAGPAPPTHFSSESPREPESMASIRSLSDTVRVEIGQLDNLLNIMGELVLQKAVLYQLAKELSDREGSAGLAGELLKAVQTMEHRLGELQEGLVEARMVPLGQLYDRLARAAKKLSRELGKTVDLRMSGDETRLDKTMVEAIADPLLHLIRNSMDHGIEPEAARQAAGKSASGQITLRAKPQGTSVIIEVEDDGRGIDLARVREIAIQRGLADPDKQYDEAALINFLFQPGFSTSDKVSEVSGRGVGLDVVAKNIATFNGMVDVKTVPGAGTTFSITLPITLVIVRALLVRAGAESFAVPLSNVTETLMMTPSELRSVEGAEVIELRSRTLPILRLRDHFACAPSTHDEQELYVVVVGLAENRLGLLVDAIEGQQEIVIKTMGQLLKGVIPGVAGAAELGNRRMVLVLDIPGLLDEAAQLAAAAGGGK